MSGLRWNGADVKLKAKKLMTDSIYKLALYVESGAKHRCPIDYGYLAASINIQMRGKGTDLGAPVKAGKGAPDGFKKIQAPASDMQAHVGSAVLYAPYIEFGTVRSNAQPFLRPALDAARGKTISIVQDGAKYEFADYLRRPE